MDVKEALLRRRSVRKFTQEPVTAEQTEELLHAAMSGPSACNRRPWFFCTVTDKEKLKALQEASHFTGISAPLAIVVCGDLRNALPMQLAEYWIQDCSAATENILLRAVELGLGSVWCGIYPQKLPQQHVRKLLQLDKQLIPLNIIYIGHPAEAPEARDQYDASRIQHFD